MEALNYQWSAPLVECDNPGQRRTSPAARVSELDVSVVVVSWNTRDILRGCLRSVFEQTREVSFKMIVIDNNSHDGSAEMVRAEFPAVTLIANAENRGFAAACNQGMQASFGAIHAVA